MRITIYVLDRTCYVVEFALKVLAWVGVGINIYVLDRTSYVMKFTLKVLSWVGLLLFLLFLLPLFSLLL